MRNLLFVLISICFIFSPKSYSDEGMWLPMLIERLNINDMQKRGLQLSAEEIYSVNNASLKDAIVSFNGYCTGEIISRNGLLLTNHHCGYDAIQNHSSVENDYLGDGFWAESYKEELPNEGLFVDFLIRMEDVSSEVLDSIDFDTPESNRKNLVQARIKAIKDRETKDSNYWAEVKPFYGGGEYYLFIYERYNDVRLVGTPPESIGKFGGDTDNWMWPRHTGDFALFRVYTDPDGNAAEYSENNIPMKPKHHLPISLDGVQENDFAMILGYPGGTDRYLSSFGVKLAIELYNPSVVDVREAKLNILNDYMRADRNINIMYASKKARISNYWKYYIGQTKGLKRLRVYDKKSQLENAFSQFVASSDKNQKIYGNVLSDMEKAYDEIEKMTLSRIYLNEAAWGGPSFIRLARRSEALLKALDSGTDSLIVAAKKTFQDEVASNFKEYKKEIDKDMRRKAKAINFGIIYGISQYGLAKQIGVSNAEAEDFLNSYFIKFPEIKDYMNETIKFCRKSGFVNNIFGRRTHLSGINDKNYNVRNFQERAAINAPIQGSASEIMRLAMIKLNSKLLDTKSKNIKILLQIHDELIFEIQSSKVKEMTKIIKEIMNGVESSEYHKFTVPLLIDLNSGENWGMLH